MTLPRLPVVLAAATLLAGCHRSTPTTQGPKTGPLPTPPATSVNLAHDDGQWIMPARDYANTRFSGLTGITTDNVRSLKVTWTFSTGVLRGQDAPIVVNNTMYLITPYPNVVYALDLTKPGASVKWVFKPKPDAASQGVACCDTVNRGVTYDAGKIFFNTLDDHTVALDAETSSPTCSIWAS